MAFLRFLRLNYYEVAGNL